MEARAYRGVHWAVSYTHLYLSEDLETYDTTGFCSAYRQLTDGYAVYLARESGVEWGNINAHKDGTVEISIAPEDVSDVTRCV